MTTGTVAARTSQEREAFVVEVWNSTDHERVSSYAELVEAGEPGDFPQNVWPYRFAMLAAAHRGDVINAVLRCYRSWDEMLHTTVARMANDEPEYPRYALDLDTGEHWRADMSVTLHRQ